ncbi:hypothetical protein Tsubulata_016259 [Turnera subulata]|uniref:Translocator protein homolog n=1 Tax=Turnera subulata TaxID=218843 RepID=A0A9Q0JAF7_9ROSI|nr:hypothetical protein Tsubulata_016259 [Turnera subulata]
MAAKTGKTLKTHIEEEEDDQDTTKKTKLKTYNFWSTLSSFFAVTVFPLFLTLTIIYLFGSGRKYRALAKPFWFPPLTVIHLASVGSTLLISRAAWLVWTSGGFDIDSDALPLYIAQIFLSIVWDPLVLRIGAAWLGFLFCLVNLGTLCACYWMFGKVNPSSKVFVKPCLAWVAYLTLVTFQLMWL